MSTMRERAEAGAALLDETLGTRTWDKRIDLDQLRMSDACNCVLGQLYGDEADGESGYSHGQDVLNVPSSQYGFSLLGFDVRRSQWGALTRTWKRLIRERIAARRRS